MIMNLAMKIKISMVLIKKTNFVYISERISKVTACSTGSVCAVELFP